MPRKPDDPRQKAALRKIAGGTADVEKILDDTVRLVEWTLDAVRTEMTSGLNVKGGKSGAGRAVTPADMRALADLTAMCDRLVSAKDRWMKVAKNAGARLTPAEVLEAAVQRILRLDTAERREVINRLVAEHNGKRQHPGQFGLPGIEGTSNRPQDSAPPPASGASAQVQNVGDPAAAPTPRTALDAITDLIP